MSPSHKSTVMSLASEVKSGSPKDREKAVDDLAALLNPRNRSTALNDLGDKSYHEIFEAIFSFVLRDKPNLYGKGKSQTTSNAAASRLSKCAIALRMAVSRGVSKLNRKTLLAIIDHITQVLPGPHDGFVEPLLQDYVKSLTELLSRQAHVELLARQDGATWNLCVDFLLDVVNHILPNDGYEEEMMSRASPAPGSNRQRVTGRSIAATQSQKRTSLLEGGPLRNALDSLHHLVIAANAPILRRCKDIAGAAIKVLRLRHLSLGSLQTVCFSLVNVAFSASQADDIPHSNILAREVLPLASYWWRADKVSQDELIRALRNEISKVIFLIRFHLEYLSVGLQDPKLCNAIEDLIEPLWLEYSRRSDMFRLQLADITFATATLPHDHLKLELFGLRPHNVEAESQWAVVQNMCFLETVLLRSKKAMLDSGQDEDEHPRKRQKKETGSSRIRLQLKSKDVRVCQTALQLVPFLLAEKVLDRHEVGELLVDLVALAADKNPVIASWALVACASCALRLGISDGQEDIWRQLWHMSARLVSLPGTCRAACLLLHHLLDAGLLPYHAIAGDINSIVTTADVNGPGHLCDTSLALMYHLLHTRNASLPNASQTTYHHIIRWAFMRWNPSDQSYASFQAPHVRPLDFANLLRVCCGGKPLSAVRTEDIPGGALSETWKKQAAWSGYIEYLLLLEGREARSCSSPCEYLSDVAGSLPVGDASSFYASKKLVLELLYPKLEDLAKLCASWTRKSSDGGTQISVERFQSLLAACVIAMMLVPYIGDLNTSQSSTVESMVLILAETSLDAALNSMEPLEFTRAMFRLMRPCIPTFAVSDLERFLIESPHLLRLMGTVHDTSDRQDSGKHLDGNPDSVDIDDEFESQSSNAPFTLSSAVVPRLCDQMTLDSKSFYLETSKRLLLLKMVHDDPHNIGLIPDTYVNQLLALSDDDLLRCQKLLTELFRSNLVVSETSTLRVVERLGAIVSQLEYQCCEVALTTCIEVIEGTHPLWLSEGNQLAESVGDLYNHFVQTCLPSNILSPNAQISMASLLLTLMKADINYASNLGLDSSRTSLLYVLRNGPMRVKYYVSEHIADIFELFILMVHDDIFVDVLGSLPTEPEDISGIAFRLLVLAKLACRWPTLLRRCAYHIFETPGKIPQSTDYAHRCLKDVSDALQLESPRDLFRLFSRQLLYTWLENDAIEDIPFSIFGFSSLSDLLCSSQSEAIGLLIMRGQFDACAQLAQHLGCSESDFIRRNFATALAFSMIFGDAFGGADKGRGEAYIQKKLGAKLFQESIYTNFVDIAFLFFDLIDQEDSIEKAFSKRSDLQYASDIMKAIKSISHSPSRLPPNQQPMFRAKFLVHELFRICQSTEFSVPDLWTPVLVVSIARKLLNTVHPALGALHTCSVLRKVRILVCLAANVATELYCCEMLLNSTRNFIVDSECADDALGIHQYLLDRGNLHLKSRPSFLAGYALSTLASLRVFLESSQSSTTQESQFRATMSKAQNFHEWFEKYLIAYDSDMFQGDDQRESFRSITLCAARVRSSGNAEKGTPESKLLLDILNDSIAENHLLDRSSRRMALQMLCRDFSIPSQLQDDALESDDDAVHYAPAIWESCKIPNLGKSYKTWAGRLVGRSFSVSGAIPPEVLRESRLSEYRKLAPGSNSSEMGLLSLLQDLASSSDSVTASLGEAALRTAVSEAIARNDEPLMIACQQILSEPLYATSQWGSYHSPPSEAVDSSRKPDDEQIWDEDISCHTWLPRLSAQLANSVTQSTVLSVLRPILEKEKDFAEKAFPFIVHLVLSSQLEQQQLAKDALSGAIKGWLKNTTTTAIDKQSLLINAILYLRTQEYPKESSIADRLHWLDVDYSLAASTAARCGMYRTALLFTELVSSETTRSSRRSSAPQDGNFHQTLLTVFENMDDPDAYYGLPEETSLSKILARIEHESEGSKTLAFRGAQYDSHIRLRDPAADSDAQALVKALGTHGLSGLSHSLLQTQQSSGSTATSLESTFRTARRLEIWNLPAPASSDHHAVTMYKAYQSMHHAPSLSIVQNAVYGGFSGLMRTLVGERHNVTNLRDKLAALAGLSEFDELLNAKDSSQLGNILLKFDRRTQWMRSGLYEDINQILSYRATSMSMLTQHVALLDTAKFSTGIVKESEVKSMIMSSRIYRYHQATQESLNIATALNDLITPCMDFGIWVDAAAKMETAESLWDHGEMGTSIRMLQDIDDKDSLKQQSISISRSDLLSKIAQKVSLARLEKPQEIQRKYLAPALKELRGNSEGREAGLVFHQFAVFCDDQLQDPDGLEDLARLQGLQKGKSLEVEELKSLISSTRESQLKTRYSHVLAKEKQWLELDEQELRRVEHTRGEFVRLSLENYLRSLIASDEHNNDALRFTALWLERSGEDATNDAVTRFVDQVPTRKFASLMNQLTSRLQNQNAQFQTLLLELVYNICVDHPYHGMYQIWSGTKAKAQQTDEVAIQRVKATEKVAQRLSGTKSVADIWLAIDKTSKYYHGLAMDRNSTKYKSGAKIPIRESQAGSNLVNYLARYRIPPPTMHIDICQDKDYSHVPMISKLEQTMTIASGVSAPKIITVVASNGEKFKQLVKGGHDDLRQDAIMEQVFAAVSSLLKLHRATQQRNLGIRTYKVLPLTASSGLIEFVPNTIPLHEFLMPAHERYYPRDMKGSHCRKEIFNVQSRSVDARINIYRKVTDRFHPVMKYFFMEYFVDPDEWFARRLAYTRSTAAISMLGHVLGLGDRHGHNILLDTKTGEAVHIDLGVAFEAGRILPVPELVPFRLTRDIVDGMGITKTEGVFRRCCEFTLDALREEQYSIMTILDVLRYDPLYTWSISPLRLAKLQKARHNDDGAMDDTEQAEAETKKKAAGELNEPSEADRALEVVRKKLSKTLSVTATVNDLINQATDERNLAVLYSGWAAYA